MWFFPKPIVGIISILLYTLMNILIGLYILVLAPFKYVLPIKPWRNFIRRLHRLAAPMWSATSNGILWLTTRIEWDISIKGNIAKNQSYFLIANHASWMDIIVLQKVIGKIAPPAVYFMKRQLLWVPFIGICCWLMDFPFLRRHSRQYLLTHPEAKGKDIETTQRTCRRYQKFPVTLVSYVEGTRYTEEKAYQQQTPYQFLLKPRGGGLAFVLNAMRDQVKSIIDTTIIYFNQNYSLWDFLCGKAKRIKICIELIPVTSDLIGDYVSDDKFREHFQAWLNKIWQKKDHLIKEILNISNHQ